LQELITKLEEICALVAEDTLDCGVEGKTVTLKIKQADFKTEQKQITHDRLHRLQLGDLSFPKIFFVLDTFTRKRT